MKKAVQFTGTLQSSLLSKYFCPAREFMASPIADNPVIGDPSGAHLTHLTQIPFFINILHISRHRLSSVISAAHHFFS
jgi:hypothetical protein